MKKWGEMSHDEFTQAVAYAVVGYNNKLKETKYVRKKGVKKMNKIPAGCEGCRNCMYWDRNGCIYWKKQLKKTTVWLVQPYHTHKEQGRKLKRYPCIQGYGLWKGGMYIVEEQKD